MNKTVVFITFVALAAVGLIGCMVIIIHRPDATATFTSLLITVLGLATSAAGLFYGLGKQGEKLERQDQVLDTIQKQTNGNLSRRDATIDRLTNLLIEKGIDPSSGVDTGSESVVGDGDVNLSGRHARVPEKALDGQ
ncbi:hypothetical protein ALI44B_04545 [Leifsonia sp. ALI-44-B]|uniref:hypothetical protein n=1 Tax=Leifsonia sp. ALI-44-B TaxID=1933776 RepID=UPI00097C8B51|nr:hypothetical protein [Leifsonia sp. ALI-44-B]ONI63899.1 hypothetical protein ALI44B_04545 [Leifsonia sp. ALI-44-B]